MITACDYALQMFTGHTGCLHVFPALSMEKGCKNHRETLRETLYSSKGKIVHVVGKPFNIYRLRGNPMMIIRFPAICNYYLVSPQQTQSFPIISITKLPYIGFICDSDSPFS